MKLSLSSILVLSLWAGTTLAADTPVSNPAATPTSAANPTSASSTNDTIEQPLSGKNYTNTIGMELIPISGGVWAGKYEVTQKEYFKLLGFNPSAFQDQKRPVDSVSYNDAMDFCAKLTDRELKSKNLPTNAYYTLPSESEWTGLVGDAKVEDAVTSLHGNIHTSSAECGSTVPNSLGLYDVRGNLMEFVISDETKAYRVLKGGSWQDRNEINLRPEFRWNCQPDERQSTFGFRCLLKLN